MKGGPFGLSLLWPDLALGGFRNVSKKWTDQCEVCGLKKKKVTAKKENAPTKNGHCYSRACFLKRKTRRLKMKQNTRLNNQTHEFIRIEFGIIMIEGNYSGVLKYRNSNA